LGGAALVPFSPSDSAVMPVSGAVPPKIQCPMRSLPMLTSRLNVVAAKKGAGILRTGEQA
jgi:hypothetical protein